jgi:hypothetical protein
MNQLPLFGREPIYTLQYAWEDEDGVVWQWQNKGVRRHELAHVIELGKAHAPGVIITPIEER